MFQDIIKTNQFDFERLDISYCDFNHEGFSLMIDALKSTFSVKYLNFEGNSIGNFDEIGRSLQTFFSSLTKLNHIIFTKCELDDDSAGIMSLALMKSKALKVLDLNKNNISDEGMLYLSKTFSEMKIESIDLSDNEISNKGFEVMLFNMDNHNFIGKLNFKNNKIFEDLGERACIFVQQNKNIIQLSLEKNMVKHSHLAEIYHGCGLNRKSNEKQLLPVIKS